jgi:hypothetical protein
MAHTPTFGSNFVRSSTALYIYCCIHSLSTGGAAAAVGASPECQVAVMAHKAAAALEVLQVPLCVGKAAGAVNEQPRSCQAEKDQADQSWEQALHQTARQQSKTHSQHASWCCSTHCQKTILKGTACGPVRAAVEVHRLTCLAAAHSSGASELALWWRCLAEASSCKQGIQPTLTSTMSSCRHRSNSEADIHCG